MIFSFRNGCLNLIFVGQASVDQQTSNMGYFATMING